MSEQLEPNPSFNVLVGSSAISDYAQVSFLVLSDRVEDLLQALSKAENSFFHWSIDEDDTITDVRNIPASIAHILRSFGTIPQHGRNGEAISEAELLDWLIHGEDHFSYQYAVLQFMDGKRGPDGGYSGRVAFEISNEKYMPFYDYCQELYNHSEYNGDMVYLSYCELIDRQSFLKEFSGRGHCVDRATFRQFKRDSEDKSEIGSWADENRHLVFRTTKVDQERGKDDDFDDSTVQSDDLHSETSSLDDDTDMEEIASIAGSEVADLEKDEAKK